MEYLIHFESYPGNAEDFSEAEQAGYFLALEEFLLVNFGVTNPREEYREEMDSTLRYCQVHFTRTLTRLAQREQEDKRRYLVCAVFEIRNSYFPKRTTPGHPKEGAVLVHPRKGQRQFCHGGGCRKFPRPAFFVVIRRDEDTKPTVHTTHPGLLVPWPVPAQHQTLTGPEEESTLVPKRKLEPWRKQALSPSPSQVDVGLHLPQLRSLLQRRSLIAIAISRMGNSAVAAIRTTSGPSSRWIVWGSLLSSLIFLLVVARQRLHGISSSTIGSLPVFDDDEDDDSSNISPLQLRYQALCVPQAESLGWEFAGPSGYVTMWNEGTLPAAAAVQNLVVTPDSFFLSSVNGGIWRTWRKKSNPLHWENVLDGQEGVTCTSMSALIVSGTSIYAGCGGATSSEQGYDHNVLNTGDWGGVMMSSTEGTMAWRMLEAFPPNYFVTDLLEITVPNDDEAFLLVAAQSHLYNATDGGVWKVPVAGNDGESERVSWNPTFTLTRMANGAILATHGHTTATSSVSVSWDHGNTFSDYGRLPWNRGYVPFYTCAAEMRNGLLVVAGLTRQSGGLPNATDSQFFVRKNNRWSELSSAPTRMDQDSMPKDRMALLADPELDHLLYVAGNAESLAWRVDVDTGTWTPLWDTPDVLDGSVPHADCRNFAWDDSAGGRLLLVTDGGVYARIRPREAVGKWISLNGDYSALELLSAHYDPQYNRFVMGAQDNCALFTKPNAMPSDAAFGFVEGDGTTTLVDSTAGHPSRLFGTVQFLGVMGDNEKDSAAVHTAEGNKTCGGLCFLQGKDTFVEVEVEKYFPEPSTFPFFDHPYTLNQQDPTRLHFWTNGTGPERPSAIYEFRIPYSVQDKDDIGPPTKVIETPQGAMILQFVSGGYTAGEADPGLVVAMSSTDLYVRNRFDPVMIAHPLPVRFADPVTLQYDADGKRILGPLTHARTVAMSVLASDSRVVVVTGWQTVRENTNDEDIYVTSNAGRTWQNITGNLRAVSGVSGKVRPGGVLILGLSDSQQAVLSGSSNGIMVAFLPSKNPQWNRLGTCKEFPIVLTADVSYEPTTDRLVAATFGRGIYVLKNAMSKLVDLQQKVMRETQP